MFHYDITFPFKKLSIEAKLYKSGNDTRNCVTQVFIDESESKKLCSKPIKLLNNLRIKNHNSLMIGSLNINSLWGKFDQLKCIIGTNLDILVLQETKIDESFPDNQFLLPFYSKPFRLDRNKSGGGVIIYVKESIPSKKLNKHNFSKNIEGLFVEINLRKRKLLFFGGYRSNHEKYGTKVKDFFHELTLSLDTYKTYDQFLVVGDFNTEMSNKHMADFLSDMQAVNLVKVPTCFKNVMNPTSIDVFLTNCASCFQNTNSLCTGISDFHNLIVTVFKVAIPKSEPKILQYRSFKKFSDESFQSDLRRQLSNKKIVTYEAFEEILFGTLNKYAPVKKRTVRCNNKPFMSKKLRKAIMKRSMLKNKYLKEKTSASLKKYHTHKNYTNRLAKKEKSSYISNLDLGSIKGSRNFWSLIGPLFSNKNGITQQITLVDDDKIISDDIGVAKTFNEFFKSAIKSLNITDNILLLNDTSCLQDSVKISLEKFKDHPSIREINKRVTNISFSFKEINRSEIEEEISNLKNRKAIPFSDIPTKLLKKVSSIVSESLCDIWNVQIMRNGTFPNKLKLADIKPVHKKLEQIFAKNYRPVSILSVISKVFERLMQKQMNDFVNKFLSPVLCGYRKGFSPQYALLAMIEKWKKSLDKQGFAGGVLMDLSKAFDTINYELLIAKLHAYGFHLNSLKILMSYLTNRWQRVKINSCYSTWDELLCGVPQGSILGPILFNIYLNDLFYFFSLTNVCNIADDTTPYACDLNLGNLIFRLENDTLIAVSWFEANFMKLNADKCHFLLSGNSIQSHWVTVGDAKIWESRSEVLLGLTIDKYLKFDIHLNAICKKVGQKISALARLIYVVPIHKKRLLMKSFIESQFAYCPLIWMFCKRSINNRINRLHERALRVVYNDYVNSFETLLSIDGSVTIHHRNIQRGAIEMYKIKNGLAPDFICDLFLKNEMPTRSDFVRPKIRTTAYGEKSFVSFGTIVWNKLLPTTYKSLNDLTMFKKVIKNWFPVNCPCNLCATYVQGVGYV